MPGESFVTWTLTPVTTAAEVRRLTGYATEADCPSTDLGELILKAQTFVSQELSERVHDVALWGPIDGTNTRYELPPRFTGRVLLDAINSGNEKDSLQVYLRAVSLNGAPHVHSVATVSSTDALHGQIVLSAAPSPATHDRVLFSGLLVRASVTKERFKYVVELYAACLLDARVRGPGKVVLSNPKAEAGSMGKAFTMADSRWWPTYERELRNLRNARGAVASVKTAMPHSTSDGFPSYGNW